jgi:hemerythrin-like domain-containing protein
MSELCRSLEAEHRVIERVLEALDMNTEAVAAGAPVDKAFFTEAIAFVREYADGVHHQKEEQVLFPRLVAAGVPREGGPVGVMLYEHDEGRRLVRIMYEALAGASAGDTKARATLVDATRQYVTLLRAHIQKEDMILFPMADRIIPIRQREIVQTGFAQAEGALAAMIARRRAWAESLSGGVSEARQVVETSGT